MIKYILKIILILLANLVIAQNCKTNGFVDWETDVEILLYQQPDEKGLLIDKFTNDIKNENFLVFAILDRTDDFFKVNISRAIDEENNIGWIKKSKYLQTYSRNYGDEPFVMFLLPDTASKKTVINKYISVPLIIIDCKENWTKVFFKIKEEEYIGWVNKDNMLCPNPYTTCN